MTPRRLTPRRLLVLITLPWIAAELGWIVAEVGRQPWAVEGVLPTFLGASSLSQGQLWATIIGFTLLYGGVLGLLVDCGRHRVCKLAQPVASLFERGVINAQDIPQPCKSLETAAPG